jgi:enamine deaminase RidA (YjgF/YER057c/UK114 family)
MVLPDDDRSTGQNNPSVPQTYGLFDRRLINTLDILTREAFNQLGSTTQNIFFVGDGIQRAAISNAFDLLDPRTWAPDNVLRMTSMIVRQAGRISKLFTSPQASHLAWHELQNKIEVFLLVRNLASVLGITQDGAIDLPRLVEKAYSLPPFQALWALEGLGHDYAASVWRLHGPQKRLLWEEKAVVPESSLLMLHAGLGLFLADSLLGSETPPLVPHSSASRFSAVIETFVTLARDNARQGYLGPVIESLGLTTRELYPEMVDPVHRALNECAPELIGYYWHGVGRSLYFSRRYFLPVLSTVWAGIDSEIRNAAEQQHAMAGLAWGVILVNMRQPEIIEAMLCDNIANSPLQDGFANGVASSIIMRQNTTPDAPFIGSLCAHRPLDQRVTALWDRLVSTPCELGLDRYYPVLEKHHVLGEVFRYHDLAEFTARIEGGPARHRENCTGEVRVIDPWTWQDPLGFSQGMDVRRGRRVLYCAGQTSVDANGNPLYPHDMAKQINQALDNLETVLKSAGLTLSNVVRLHYYATDMTAFLQAASAYAPRLAAAGCKPAAMALGVTGLFRPELMIEIEATAVA